jgi:hypothetical protein
VPSVAAGVPNKRPVTSANCSTTTMVAENPFKEEFEKYRDHLNEMVCFELLIKSLKRHFCLRMMQ